MPKNTQTKLTYIQLSKKPQTFLMLTRLKVPEFQNTWTNKRKMTSTRIQKDHKHVDSDYQGLQKLTTKAVLPYKKLKNTINTTTKSSQPQTNKNQHKN